jgi:hypothetical protein
MVASARSIEQVVEILLRRLGGQEAIATIGELRRVKDNRSFLKTLQPLSSSPTLLLTPMLGNLLLSSQTYLKLLITKSKQSAYSSWHSAGTS